MKPKIIVILIVILAGAAAAGFWYSKNAKQARAPEQPTADSLENADSQANQPPGEDQNLPADSGNPATGTEPAAPAGGVFSGGEEGGMSPDILVTQVVYDGEKFSPASLDIKVGDIVIFKNESQENFWPASNDHPAHTLYPEFDAKQVIPPQGKYQFTFERAGSWGYHNHLKPAVTGVVNVSSR